MPKRALITGITGQDGSYLAELLLSKDYEVHGIIRRASTFNTGRLDHIYSDPHSNKTNLRLHYGDLSDASALAAALRGGRADSNILQEFAPQMAARNYLPTGSLNNMLKDLNGVQTVAHSAGLTLPLVSTARQVYGTLVDAGLGTAQVAELMRQFDE